MSNRETCAFWSVCTVGPGESRNLETSIPSHGSVHPISYDTTGPARVPIPFPNGLHSYDHFAPRATVGFRRETTCTERQCYARATDG
ncbi:hypothetical protein NPIL_399491 [Nephila pilipes]|uniref:Uncharacterized protein n=1 Tax=Nephila pilipes TaxID=299642 RepID=A0A8X6NDQ4_NEPPI|nr:hypothetical protein NPIL_399491 [Nephila pilipes]